MEYSDDFLAGWDAARWVAQRKGSVPPSPPGFRPEPEAASEPSAQPPEAPPEDILPSVPAEQLTAGDCKE